jgi:glucose-6-phosphate 1-dehydrogenase
MPLKVRYEEVFGRLPEAYETLILEVLQGDQTHFVRGDFAESSWQLYEPLLAGGLSLHPYAAGSWGPAEADALLEKNGHTWQRK